MRETPASFEPTIDYVVTKIPRFAFEKFPQGACARPPFTLTTEMKSVGDAMAVGRTFKESLQKCLRSVAGARHLCRFTVRQSSASKMFESHPNFAP